MKDETHGNDPAKQPNDNPIANPELSLTRDNDKASGHADDRTKNEAQIVGEMKSEFRKAERYAVIINFLGLVALIATLFIYSGQLDQMATQTGLLAVQVASSSQEGAETSKRLDAQIAALREQAVATQDSANAISTQMRQDQRAWVIVSFGQDRVGNLEINKPISVPINFLNIGKTPATTLHGFFTIRLLRRNERLNFDLPNCRETITIPALFPGEKNTVPLARVCRNPLLISGFGPTILTQRGMNDLQTGEYTMAMFGQIAYDDVFGRNHWMRVCQYTSPTEPNTRPQRNGGPPITTPNTDNEKRCSEYNNIDKP